jgi:hypothetical protein
MGYRSKTHQDHGCNQRRRHQTRKDTRQAPLPATGYRHNRLHSISKDIFFKLIWHKGF